MEYLKIWLLTGLFVVNSIYAEDKIVKKRQIFREQVLPHAGGKIPDTAFETDRLFLNNLQKEGIAVPDGVLLEHRNPKVHQYYNKASRTVFKVALSSDGRYIPVEGQYQYHTVPSIETTYLYPQIYNYPKQTPPVVPAYPIYRQIALQNTLLNPQNLQPKRKNLFYVPASKLSNPKIKSYHQPFSALNAVGNSLGGYSYSQIRQEYDTSKLFNDFDHLFDGFNLRNARNVQEGNVNRDIINSSSK